MRYFGSRKRKLLAVLVVALVAVLAAGLIEDQDSSGPVSSAKGTEETNGSASFIGQASNAVVFIQWTRSANSLSGSLQEAILKEKEDSGVESSSRAFTGTVDGDGLTLTLNEGLGSTKALVGKITGNHFALTYPGAGHGLITITFSPSQVSSYNAAVRELEAQGARTTSSEQAPPSSNEQSTSPPQGAIVGSDCETIEGRGLQFAITAGVGVSCTIARQVFRDFFADKGEHHEGTDAAESYTRVDGWTCGSGAGGAGCKRSGLRIEANEE